MDILSQTDIIFLIIVMIFTAIPAGFAAGLFGIGGGLITVPILFYIFTKAGINPAFIMHLSVGTSFGIIIPTNRLFEKSGSGNIKKPPIKPMIIEKKAVLSEMFLL